MFLLDQKLWELELSGFLCINLQKSFFKLANLVYAD